MMSNRDLNRESCLVPGENMEQCTQLINNTVEYNSDTVDHVFRPAEINDDDNNSAYVRGYN